VASIFAIPAKVTFSRNGWYFDVALYNEERYDNNVKEVNLLRDQAILTNTRYD
jgi:hypothetical protein